MAVRPVVAGAIKPVAMYRFRIMAKATAICLRLRYQASRFVVGVPFKPVHKSKTIELAERQLASKLARSGGLASDNRPHVQLADADNPIGYAPAAMVVHPLLLPVQFPNHQQLAVSAQIQHRQRDLFAQGIDGRQIPPQVVQLLPQRFTQCLSLAFARLDEGHIFSPRLVPVRARLALLAF